MTDTADTPTERGGDLFQWIDALWSKKELDGTPPMRMVHRFLASDRDYAMFARVLQRDVKDPVLLFRVWQGLLPTARGAPRLAYVGAKRAPKVEALVERMMHVRAERRSTVEEIVEFCTAAGTLDALYTYYGVEAPEVVEEPVEAPRQLGLLANL